MASWRKMKIIKKSEGKTDILIQEFLLMGGGKTIPLVFSPPTSSIYEKNRKCKKWRNK